MRNARNDSLTFNFTQPHLITLEETFCHLCSCKPFVKVLLLPVVHVTWVRGKAKKEESEKRKEERKKMCAHNPAPTPPLLITVLPTQVSGILVNQNGGQLGRKGSVERDVGFVH